MAKIDLQKIKSKVFTTKFLIIFIIGFFIISIGLMIFQSAQPKKGNILYGMCRSFLELQVQFPETLDYKRIELYRAGVRINYTHLDGFGEYRLETIECSFLQDPQKGVQMKDIFFNYVKPITEIERVVGKGRLYRVRQEEIDLFNKSRSPAAILDNIDLTVSEKTILRAY